MKAKKQLKSVSEVIRLTNENVNFEVSNLAFLDKGIFFKFPDSSKTFIFRGGNIKHGFLFSDMKEPLRDIKILKNKTVLINF